MKIENTTKLPKVAKPKYARRKEKYILKGGLKLYY